jgi:hypothetical protein
MTLAAGAPHRFSGKHDMSKGQWAFRPAVLTRAIKAAEKLY